MNNNLLLIAGAAVAYALLRPKTTASTSPAAVVRPTVNTGASTYINTAPVPTTPASSGGGLLNNAGNLINQGTALVTQGASAWDQIKGALHIGAAPTANTTAGNVWAGPTTATGVWAGPQYEDS